MTAARSDALVLFGATGDLAHKMIFLELYRLVKRGAPVPLARPSRPVKWTAGLRSAVAAWGRRHESD